MNIRNVVAAASLAALGSIAQADVIASFSYDDLSGSFVSTGAGTGNFSAVAVDTDSLQTSGDASRLVPTEGNAVFEAGFVSAANPADFVINISVVVTGATTGTGAGTFTSTDADGDTITGSIAGSWRLIGTFLAFNGNLSNVFLNDNGALDSTFNGTDASSTNWDLSLPGSEPFDGALVNLVFGASDFFVTSFDGRSTGVTAQILPAPGAAALLGLGLVAAGRRRR